MKLNILGITLEISRSVRSGLTPENVDRMAQNYKGYDGSAISRKVARIKAARSIREEMSLKDAKEWVERNFDD